MSELFDRFDTFVERRERETERGGDMLRAAVAELDELEGPGDYLYSDHAIRLKEIARKASEAASLLSNLAGTYELAAKVSESGMLEGSADS